MALNGAGGFNAAPFQAQEATAQILPPGIILEYEDITGAVQQSSLDLLNLEAETDVEVCGFFWWSLFSLFVTFERTLWGIPSQSRIWTKGFNLQPRPGELNPAVRHPFLTRKRAVLFTKQSCDFGSGKSVLML